ncbi:T9SS type A sorting domain-containing protein [candidate division WOR-3 bacterium]|nr:T9SS type A sorting domain-containing protein [candidate division WOR-3 bacterium]
MKKTFMLIIAVLVLSAMTGLDAQTILLQQDFSGNWDRDNPPPGWQITGTDYHWCDAWNKSPDAEAFVDEWNQVLSFPGSSDWWSNITTPSIDASDYDWVVIRYLETHNVETTQAWIEPSWADIKLLCWSQQSDWETVWSKHIPNDEDGSVHTTGWNWATFQQMKTGELKFRWTGYTHATGSGSMYSFSDAHVIWHIDSVIVYGYQGQPDNLIAKRKNQPWDWVGDNVYNPTGADQTVDSLIGPGDTVIFVIAVQNENYNTKAKYVVTGPGSSEGYTVRYFDEYQGGSDITSQVTGAGWITNRDDYDYPGHVRVEIVVPANAPGCDTFDVLVTSRSKAGANKDAVCARVITKEHKPDNLIAVMANGPYFPYLGDNIYNTDGANQTAADTVDPTVTAYYRIKVQNDSHNWPESFTLKGTASGNVSGADYSVHYFNDSLMGTDITNQVTGSGWSTGELALGESRTIRLEVTPQASAEPTRLMKANPMPPPVTTYDVLVTSTSSGDGSKKDVVKASTTVFRYKPDNLIALPGGSYIGDNIYNEDGATQTVVDTVECEEKCIVNIKIQNDSENDANPDVGYVVNGPGTTTIEGAVWDVRYFDALSGGNDITASVIAAYPGWIVYIPPLSSKEIRVEITPQASAEPLEPPPVTTCDVLITTRSCGYGQRKDAVKASVTVKQHKPDEWVRKYQGTDKGDDIYNSFDDPEPSSLQTVEDSVKAGYHSFFYVTFQNDGNTEEPFTITGTKNGKGSLPAIYPSGSPTHDFGVKYYNGISFESPEITSEVKGSGWVTPNLNPYGAETKTILAEVLPAAEAWGFETFVVDARSASDGFHDGHGFHQDNVRCSTWVRPYYQPDLMIKRKDEGSYHGDDIYASIVGTDDQTASYISNFWITSVFHIKIENDTNTIDPYVVTGSGDSADFTVRYYDALQGGSDITAQITGPGWTTPGLLPYGDFTEIRLEVSGDNNSDSMYEAYIAAVSVGNPDKVDTIKALVILAGGQPDGLVKTVDDERYYGDNVYNSSGDGQTRCWNVQAGGTAVYHLKIQNDYLDADQNPDFITVRGDAGNNTWSVTYYDAPSDGTDITSQVIGTGWSTGEMGKMDYKELRVEVTPDMSLPKDDSLILAITTQSTNDPNREDIVKVETTVGEEGPAVKEDIATIPLEYSLDVQSLSRSCSMLRYSVPDESEVSLVIYDVSGRVVKIIEQGKVQAGVYEVDWSNSGFTLSSGIYFCRMESGSFRDTRKLVLVR